MTVSATEILCAPYPFALVTGNDSTAPNIGNERLGRTAHIGNAVIDLGYPRPVDTVATIASDGDQNLVFDVRAFNSLADAQNGSNVVYETGNFFAWASPEAGRRLHRQGMTLMSQAVTARFWRIDSSTYVNVGRLVLGQRFTASDTRDMGYSLKVVDLGDYRRSATALDNSTTRGKVLEYAWTWSWMTEQEARGTMLDLFAYAGITRDLFLCLDPIAADLHNVIGYGKIVEMPEPTMVSGGPNDFNAYKVDLRLQSRTILNL